MRLRVARKMDPHGKRDDKRRWCDVYTDEQLRRAEVRLLRSWLTRCPVEQDGMRRVSPDFFASHRVSSRMLRQRALRKYLRDKSKETACQ